MDRLIKSEMNEWIDGWSEHILKGTMDMEYDGQVTVCTDG